jgi:hypothetical protein
MMNFFGQNGVLKNRSQKSASGSGEAPGLGHGDEVSPGVEVIAIAAQAAVLN